MARFQHVSAVLTALVAASLFASCGGGPEEPASKTSGPQASGTAAQDLATPGAPAEATPGESPDPGGAASGEKITLQLRLQAGHAYKSQMTTEQKITQTIQGTQQQTSQTIGFGFTYDVGEVRPDGTAVVEVTYDSVQYKQQGPMGQIEYDSTDPPQTIPAAAKGFAALVGQGFTLELTPLGKAAKVEGADEMLAHMLKEMNVPNEALRARMQNSLKVQFGDDALREMTEQSMAIYPDGPVGIGDSWSRRITITRGFPIVMDNTWTLKSRRDGVAVVAVQSKVSPNPDAAPVDMGFAKIAVRLSGTQNGTLELDETTGWTLRSTLNQKFSGETTIEGTPQGPMTIPMSVDSVVRVQSPEV